MSWGLCTLCGGFARSDYQNVHSIEYTDNLGNRLRTTKLCRKHRQTQRQRLESLGYTNIQTIHNSADPNRPGLTQRNVDAGPRINAARKKAKVRQLAARDGMVCFWCGRKLSYKAPHKNRYNEREDVRYPTIDHYPVRVADGGSSKISNLVLSCQPCNNDRHNPPR